MTGTEHVENFKAVASLGGLNRLSTLNNTKVEEFYALVNLIHQYDGVLQIPPGIKTRILLEGREILRIHQTNDRRENILVQTDEGVYVFSEDEFFERAYVPALVANAIVEEDTMAKAIIVQSLALNTHGGSYTPANSWQQAPLSAILSQLNADGTAAAFVTALAANIFTLAAGTYRFNIRSMHACDTAAHRIIGRLFNVTTGAPAWTGLNNENSPVYLQDSPDGNTEICFGGDLTIAVPTQFQLEHFCSRLTLTTGFGFRRNIGSRENYRWIEIIKTA